MESSERSAFPSDRQSFDADPRVSFSKLNGKFILEADDGQEYEYDGALKRWLPVVCPQSIPAMRGGASSFQGRVPR